MKMHVKYSIVFLLAVVSGAALMSVSHRVQYMEREIARTDRAIAHERESVRILQAEWAFLNNPERLETLAAQYLDLQAPEAKTLVSSMPVLPDPTAEISTAALVVDAEVPDAAAPEVAAPEAGVSESEDVVAQSVPQGLEQSDMAVPVLASYSAASAEQGGAR